VIVITDHQALTWIFSTKVNLTPRLYRWVLRVQDFDFEVKYRPGKLHVVPDALSRDGRFNPVMSLGIIHLDNSDSDLGGHYDDRCDSPNCVKPIDDVVDWVQCDTCDSWFHDVCVGITAEGAESSEFLCVQCRTGGGGVGAILDTHPPNQLLPVPDTGSHSDIPHVTDILPYSAELLRLQRSDVEFKPIFESRDQPHFLPVNVAWPAQKKMRNGIVTFQHSKYCITVKSSVLKTTLGAKYSGFFLTIPK
jgi:hypothetical protein